MNELGNIVIKGNAGLNIKGRGIGVTVKLTGDNLILCIGQDILQGALQGSLGGAAVWRLPLARGTILETQDRIPHQASGAWSLLLPLPVSLPLSLSLSVTIINKFKKKN